MSLNTKINSQGAIVETTALSASQVATPSAAILADQSTIYSLDIQPYNRYISNGTSLVPLTQTGTQSMFTVAADGSGDYTTDGIADDVQINAAIQSLPATGGTVLIKAGTYNLNASTVLINKSNVELIGQGVATKITVTNGNPCNVVSVTGTGTAKVHVKNMWLDGNQANESFGDGIYINTPWQNTDPHHVFEDLLITNCKNNGIEIAANSDTRICYFNRVHIKGCQGNGLYVPWPSNTDSFFNDCIIETNALNGFYYGGASSWFTNCNSFYNGSAGGSNFGWYISGYNNYFTGCQAQDNYVGGWYSQNDGDPTYGTQYNIMVNCQADSNNQNGDASNGCGLRLVNCRGWEIIGGAYFTRPYPSFTQRIGISLEGTTTGVVISDVIAEGNSSSQTSDTSSGLNHREVNGQFFNTIQVQTFTNPAPDHSVTIHQHATSSTTGAALNVVSDNPQTSAMLLTGVETALGTLKIKHIGQANGSDSGNAAISIDMTVTGTASQGVYVDSTAPGGTIGQLLRLRNQTVDKFVVAFDGTATMQGKLVISNGNAPASSGATGVVGQVGWDTGFFYVCTATNTWKRVAIATF